MSLSDLGSVVSLYQDANLFAKKKDILGWTKKGLGEYSHFNLVYVKGDKVIGAISAILSDKKTAMINDIAVQKSYRGNSIGSKLMKRLINILRKDNVNKITLWVHWSNAAAIPFYYRFGFRIKKCSKTKDISGVPDGEDVILLEKIV